MPYYPWTPPLLNNDQAGAMPNLIANALAGYTGATNAAYLQPQLQEELKKSKLYNQYYGPNIESQIGLRGAQAGHLGSLTTGQDITNRYLEPTLQAQLEEANLEAQQKRYFNDLLQRRLSGELGQPQPRQLGQPGQLRQPGALQQQISQQLQQQPQQPQYTQGLGQAPVMQQQNSPFQQPSQVQQGSSPFQQTMQTQQPDAAMQFNQPPQLTEEDIINKHFYKIDSYTPKLQAYEQEKRAQDQLIFQDIQAYKKDIPVALNQLKDVNYMLDQAQKHPEWFGPGLLGYDAFGPSYRERNIHSKEFGKWKNKLSKIISRGSQELSSKPLALALKTAIEFKPNFKDNHEVAVGNLEAIRESLLRAIQNSNEFVSQKTGQNLINPSLIQQELLKLEKENEPTIEVHFNGHILDVPKSEISKYKGKPGVKIVEK